MAGWLYNVGWVTVELLAKERQTSQPAPSDGSIQRKGRLGHPPVHGVQLADRGQEWVAAVPQPWVSSTTPWVTTPGGGSCHTASRPASVYHTGVCVRYRLVSTEGSRQARVRST